jgi:hypothetical protein
MPLTGTDWAVLVAFLRINLHIGVYSQRRASGDAAEFFNSPRDVS